MLLSDSGGRFKASGLQRIREFAADDCPVLIADEHALRDRFTLGQLRPCSFGPAHLPR